MELKHEVITRQPNKLTPSFDSYVKSSDGYDILDSKISAVKHIIKSRQLKNLNQKLDKLINNIVVSNNGNSKKYNSWVATFKWVWNQTKYIVYSLVSYTTWYQLLVGSIVLFTERVIVNVISKNDKINFETFEIDINNSKKLLSQTNPEIDEDFVALKTIDSVSSITSLSSEKFAITDDNSSISKLNGSNFKKLFNKENNLSNKPLVVTLNNSLKHLLIYTNR
jgi:hypothetical protein